MAHRRDAGWRDRATGELMAEALDRVDLSGDVITMLDGPSTVMDAVRERGARPHPWHRRAVEGRPASAWPPEGPFDGATLRLPRSKDELEMAVHAAAASLRPGRRLWVYGAKDEGIGSASARIGSVMGSVRTVATGGRGRVLEAVRPEEVSGLRVGLEAWRGTVPLGIPGMAETWVSYPGVFAHGRLDEGTRALIEAMPNLRAGSRVLDFACGSGVLGGLVLSRDPSSSVDFLDVDAVALEAVRANVPGARVILSDGFGTLTSERYDLIVSNPPYHQGKEQTGRVLEHLAARAPAQLLPGGALLLVAQRRLPVRRLLDEAFARVEVLRDEGPYRVWRSVI